MTRITDSVPDKQRFANCMMLLYKAHGMKYDKDQTAVYFEALKPKLMFESLEYATGQSIGMDDRFPKIPRLVELAKSMPPYQDLSKTAIPEDCTPPDVAADNLKKLNEMPQGFGCGSFQ